MGLQIIKQPNGLYCLYSSNSDNVSHYDCTIEEIVNVFVSEYVEEMTRKVKRITQQLDNGEKPYNQFTLSFEQMLEQIKEIHGEEEFEKVKLLF